MHDGGDELTEDLVGDTDRNLAMVLNVLSQRVTRRDSRNRLLRHRMARLRSGALRCSRGGGEDDEFRRYEMVIIRRED